MRVIGDRKNGVGRQLGDMPQVSISICVYNGEKYLKRAIESVVNQTYEGEYEVLLLDDGSTDDSATICKEYTERYPFVQYHYHENMGLARTRERAVDLAKGEFLCWVDADDYVSPDLLKVTMQKIKETGADICFLSWQAVWENGKAQNHRMGERSLEEWRKQAIAGEFTSAWVYISKRKLWINEKTPWQVWRNAEDAYLTPILFKKAENIVSVPEILYHYKHDNPSSTTHSYSGMKLLGVGFATYTRFKLSLENCPDLVEELGKYALRMLTRAYAVGTYLNDLNVDQKELLRTYILEVADHLNNYSFRNRYRVFFIRHRWNGIMRIIGRISFDKKKRQNKKLIRR